MSEMWIVGVMGFVAVLLTVYVGRSVVRDFRGDEFAWGSIGVFVVVGGAVFMSLAAYMLWQFISAGGL